MPEMTDKAAAARRFRVLLWVVAWVFVVLVVAAPIVLQWHAQARVDRALVWFRQQGFPTTLDELDARRRQDWPWPNAADIYEQAFSAYVELTEDHISVIPVVGEAKMPDLSDSLPAEMTAAIDRHLESNAEALDLLRKAAGAGKCRFPLALVSGPGMHISHLAKAREGARLLALSMITRAERGDTGGFVRDLSASFGLSRALRQDQIMISVLVASACDAIATNPVQRGLSRRVFDDAALSRMADILDRRAPAADLGAAFVSEAAFLVNTRNASYEDIGKGILPFAPPPSGLDAALAWTRHATGQWPREIASALGFYRQAILASRLPPKDQAKAFDALSARASALTAVSGHRTSIESLIGVHVEMRRRDMSLACLRAAVAVERYRLGHGRLPERLDALIPKFMKSIPEDVFDSKPLKYKVLSPDAFLVYSVGQDRVDDGGNEGEDGRYNAKDIVIRVGNRRPAPAPATLPPASEAP